MKAAGQSDAQLPKWLAELQSQAEPIPNAPAGQQRYRSAAVWRVIGQWLELARITEANDPTAAALATCDQFGQVNCRMVLLKKCDVAGIHFCSNRCSQKGNELDANPQASLVLYWKSLRSQIRFSGKITVVESEQSDQYFHDRHKQSRLAALASHQSQPLANRAELLDRYRKLQQQYQETDPARPDYWVGYNLVPTMIELWSNHHFRMHNRIKFVPQSIANIAAITTPAAPAPSVTVPSFATNCGAKEQQFWIGTLLSP